MLKIIILLITLTTLGGGYYVVNNPGVVQSFQTVEVPSDWDQTGNINCKFTIHYPPTWEATLDHLGSETCILDLKDTINQNNELTLITSSENNIYKNNLDAQEKLKDFKKVAVGKHTAYVMPGTSSNGESYTTVYFLADDIGYQFTYPEGADEVVIANIYNTFELTTETQE